MKKGSLLDIGYILVFFTAAVFIMLLAEKVSTDFTTNFKLANNNSNMSGYNETVTIMENAAQGSRTFTDSLVYFVFGLALASVILAFMIPVNPVFFPLSIFALALFIFMATMNANVLYTYINSSSIITTANSHPLIVAMVQYLPHLVAVIGGLIILAMHAKSGGTTE